MAVPCFYSYLGTIRSKRGNAWNVIFQPELVQGHQRDGLSVGQLRGQGAQVSSRERRERGRREPQASRERPDDIYVGQNERGSVRGRRRGRGRSVESFRGRRFAAAPWKTPVAPSVRTRGGQDLLRNG